MTTMGGEPFGRVLSGLAAEAPDRVAFLVDGRPVSRSALENTSNRLAWTMLEAGVEVNDFVTIASDEPVQFVAAAFAAWKIGATPQPISHRLPEAELERIVELADPPVLVGVDAQHALGRPAIPPSDELSADEIQPPPERVARSWKAPMSGGSTGAPKLIVSTDPGRFDPRTLEKWRILPGKTMVVPAPLYHNAPFQTALYGILAGCTVVHLRRFDTTATLESVDRHRAQWLYLVPTMMARIIRMPDRTRAAFNLTSLRTVWHLAAPCPPWLKRAWIDWLGPERIWELYSATEGIAFTIINGSEWLRHPGSVGRVATGKMRILDESGSQLPVDKVGEIFMHPGEGRPLPYRYVGAQARSMDGWQSVGDLGHFDADGYLYLRGRKSDMMIIGGVNVYPAEIEAVIEQHPNVVGSVVIGIPDDDLGQRGHAFVQAKEQTSQDDIKKFIRERLAPHKVPQTIEFVNYQLIDDTGKTRRDQLRSEIAHRTVRTS